MSLADELEVNPFYNFALNKQTYLQQVLSNGSILCVPSTSTLPVSSSTARFLELHILKPSRLYKGQYVTVWSNVNGEHQTVSWDEHNYSLTAVYAGQENTVHILYSEMAYMQGAKYNVLLIDRPLNVLKHEVPISSIPQTVQVYRIDITETSVEDMKQVLVSNSFKKLSQLVKTSSSLRQRTWCYPHFYQMQR
ncbi:hypothetical protein EB796_007192 [Bugula neritina]|uniref:Uncharacterized protein n=1 Tax=Bugula neritina TaxID=10212 RepID=A0A7J7K786_BUGNE|nr:hypothetical protein EB796_007192 [Bugula neritina]